MFVPFVSCWASVWFAQTRRARRQQPRASAERPWGRTSLPPERRPSPTAPGTSGFQISDGPSTIAAASFSLMRTLAFMITNAISQSRKRSAPSPSSARKRQPACPLAAMKFTARARPTDVVGNALALQHEVERLAARRRRFGGDGETIDRDVAQLNAPSPITPEPGCTALGQEALNAAALGGLTACGTARWRHTSLIFSRARAPRWRSTGRRPWSVFSWLPVSEAERSGASADHHGRHALDLHRARELVGALHHRTHAERPVGLDESAASPTLPAIHRKPAARLNSGRLSLHRGEDRRLERGEIAGDLRGVEQTRETAQLGVVPDRRHRAEGDVGRQLLLPRGDQRMKVAAVRAAVVEELRAPSIFPRDRPPSVKRLDDPATRSPATEAAGRARPGRPAEASRRFMRTPLTEAG